MWRYEGNLIELIFFQLRYLIEILNIFGKNKKYIREKQSDFRMKVRDLKSKEKFKRCILWIAMNIFQEKMSSSIGKKLYKSEVARYEVACYCVKMNWRILSPNGKLK